MALTFTLLEGLKPRKTEYSIADRDGLLISVLPTGTLVWRYRYLLEGKRRKLTIGPYPAIGLADARERQAIAAKLVAKGVDPSKEKQAEKARLKIEAARSVTFKTLAEEWYQKDVSPMSEAWRYNVRNWLELDIYAAFGNMDPREVTRVHIEALLKKIVDRGAPNSAAKVLSICKKIFDFAEKKGEISLDPTIKIKPVKTPGGENHRPLAIKEIKPFLAALEADGARLVSKLAIRLLMLTFVRKDELRLAKWKEFDFQHGEWEIPGHRMKKGRDHIVYMSRQVVAILEQLKTMSAPDGYILPSISTLSKPIGHTTLNSVIDRLDINGGRFVPHGFRATASTILNEAHFREDAVERQLAHLESNKARAAYNKAEYAGERREMLQWWADILDQLERENVVPLKFSRMAQSH